MEVFLIWWQTHDCGNFQANWDQRAKTPCCHPEAKSLRIKTGDQAFNTVNTYVKLYENLYKTYSMTQTCCLPV